MTLIESIFQNRSNLIIPFIVAGDPTIETSEEVLLALDAAGADIIEIGIPFSDPIADGPVISAAMHRALGAKTTPVHVIGTVSRLRSQISAGIIAMVSHSIVRKSGGTTFIERLAEAGFDGIIIPDIDDIEAETLSAFCDSIGISFTLLVAPTTPLNRVAKLAQLSSGFLYVLARTGLTGEQSELPDLQNRIAAIRGVTELPIAIGFGISTASQVTAVQSYADGAIVGSALVRRMHASANPAQEAGDFLTKISK
jgi:tryptophan synthase alpha chain